MIKPDTSPDIQVIAPAHPEEAAKNYRTTALGWLVLKATDEVRLQRLQERCGRYPVEVRAHLASRYNPDGTVSLSETDCHETLGPFMGPGMPPLIEEELKPAPVKVIDGEASGTIPLHEPDL